MSLHEDREFAVGLHAGVLEHDTLAGCTEKCTEKGPSLEESSLLTSFHFCSNRGFTSVQQLGGDHHPKKVVWD